MSTYIRPTEWQDIELLSKQLRDEDVEELAAAGWTPFNALSEGFNRAQVCFTVVPPHLPNEIIGVCGVGPTSDPNTGLVWFLGSEHIHNHKIRFLKDSREVVDLLFQLSGYEVLYNHTYYKNTLHHAWLKWLGFKFIASNGFFHEFVRMKTCVDPLRAS